MRFERTQPCNNCPYRIDAPLRLWDKVEYVRLLSQDEQWGGIYQCHKKDDHVCVGWLMKQDEQGFPNLALRLHFIRTGMDRSYLDKLNCKVPLYESIEEMAKANYPEL